jgi:hypothetical protein
VRKLKCLQMSGNSVQEVLDEFNERRMEFGVTEESDVISVSALPPTLGTEIAGRAGSVAPKVEVVIVYWGRSGEDKFP